jgi:hypothetical protein
MSGSPRQAGVALGFNFRFWSVAGPDSVALAAALVVGVVLRPAAGDGMSAQVNRYRP